MQMTEIGGKYVANVALNQHVLNSLTDRSITKALWDILCFAGRCIGFDKGVGNARLKFPQ